MSRSVRLPSRARRLSYSHASKCDSHNTIHYTEFEGLLKKILEADLSEYDQIKDQKAFMKARDEDIKRGNLLVAD